LKAWISILPSAAHLLHSICNPSPDLRAHEVLHEDMEQDNGKICSILSPNPCQLCYDYVLFMHCFIMPPFMVVETIPQNIDCEVQSDGEEDFVLGRRDLGYNTRDGCDIHYCPAFPPSHLN
jgi:hypothetical protein